MLMCIFFFFQNMYVESWERLQILEDIFISIVYKLTWIMDLLFCVCVCIYFYMSHDNKHLLSDSSAPNYITCIICL